MTRPTETGPAEARPGTGARMRVPGIRVAGIRARCALAALIMGTMLASFVGAQSDPATQSPLAVAAAEPQAGPPAEPPLREPQSPMGRERLDLRGPDVGFPGVGRVLLGFALCAVLALGATLLLRRYWPAAGFIKGNAEVAGIRVVGRARVEASLRLSVVETAGTRVLIAEGRNGVAAVVLAHDENRGSPGAAAQTPGSP